MAPACSEADQRAGLFFAILGADEDAYGDQVAAAAHFSQNGEGAGAIARL